MGGDIHKKTGPFLALPLLMELAGGFPNPPPEGALKRKLHEDERDQPPPWENCIGYAKFNSSVLQNIKFSEGLPPH